MATSAMVFVLLSANSRGSQDYGIWAVIAGIITGAIFGWVNGIILTKLRVPSFVATLGMWYVGLGIATVLFGTTAIPFLSERSISGWNTRLSHGVPNSFWAAAAAVLLGTLLLRFTTIGRHTLAIGNNEVIARNSGLKVDQTKIAIFTIAGALTGVAGILGAIQLGSGSLDVGNGTLFITIPAVVIGGTALSGGKGGIFRTVLGTFLLIILSNGLILAGVSANYQSGVAGAILIIAIILSKLSYRESAGSIK
jgi:ribose transport system permease protein